MSRWLCRRAEIFNNFLRKPFPRTLTAFASTGFSTTLTPHLDQKTKQNLESVVDFLSSYGFSQTQVDRLHAKWPQLVRVRVEKNLKPKLQWLARVGIPAPEITKLVVSNPTILKRSLDNVLKPNCEFLRCFTGRTEDILNVIGRNSWFLTFDPRKTMIPNIAHLVDLGVPGDHILQLLVTQPRTLMNGPAKFVKAVERVSNWGFNPQLSLFVHAVRAVCGMNRLTLESKMNLYKSMGWSEDDIGLAVRRAPLFLMVSEEKIKKSADFFISKVGLKPSNLCRLPKLFMYGLEKRIFPRFAVMQALKSKGLLQNKSGDKMSVGLFTCSEMVFANRYVRRHMGEVPELMGIYHGKIEGCEAFNCSGGHRE